MIKRIPALGSIIIFLMVLNSAVAAEETVREILTKQYTTEKDICVVVKNGIKNGLDTKEVTKAAILMGHDACLVVRCAIEADGVLEQIINGALEAGTTKDVCAKCAVIAGADPIEVARIIEAGPAPLAVGLSPIELGLPGGDTGGGFLSPKGF
jgi:hypothetical protein